jgi:hypothetical protein
MEFLALLFILSFSIFVAINAWDEWEERAHKLFSEDGRFLRHHFLRALIKRPEPIIVDPNAKFAIQSAGIAHRCEVCHQPDCFNIQTGFCTRCSHITR